MNLCHFALNSLSHYIRVTSYISRLAYRSGMDQFGNKLRANPKATVAVGVAIAGVVALGEYVRRLQRKVGLLQQQLEVLSTNPAEIDPVQLPEGYLNDHSANRGSSDNASSNSSSESKSSPSDAIGIEHNKPLSERTYEQTKLKSEYLLMHYGEQLSGKFVPNVGENALSLDIGPSRPGSTSGDFGDFSIFDVQQGKKVAPQYPIYALDFPTRVAQLALHFAPANCQRALDVGCAVGRTAFELTARIPDVVGLDYSHMFIDVANRLAQGEELKYVIILSSPMTFL